MSDEPIKDPEGHVLGEGSPEMVPGENLKMLPPPPPRPAFGSGKLLDLKTGKIVHPSLGEVDASEFITEVEREVDALPPLPPDAVHGTPTPPANELPPFELPKDEDDPAGSVPAHHTVEQAEMPKLGHLHDWSERDGGDELREKIEAEAEKSAKKYEAERAGRAKRYLADVTIVAPDIAKAVNSVYNSFITEGFAPEAALALTQTVIDKKLHPFL